MFLLVLIAVAATLVVGGRKTLKPLFHLLSVLLGTPAFLFAIACLVMQNAVSRGGLLSFLKVIYSFLATMYLWGTIVMLVCFATVVAAGFHRRWQRAAAVMVGSVALGSAAVMHEVAGMPEDFDQCWLFLPGTLSLLIAVILFAITRADAREFVLDYSGGLRINRHLSIVALHPLQGQSGFQIREIGSTGWSWYRLPSFQDGVVTINVELGFHSGALEQISLSHDDPGLYGTTFDSCSIDQEHLRVKNTRAWLQSKGFPVGAYPWGEVWANYDPRSNCGSAGVRYAHPSTERRVTTSPQSHAVGRAESIDSSVA